MCPQKHTCTLIHRDWRISSYTKKIIKNLSPRQVIALLQDKIYRLFFSAALNWDAWLKGSLVLGTPSPSDLGYFWSGGRICQPSLPVLSLKSQPWHLQPICKQQAHTASTAGLNPTPFEVNSNLDIGFSRHLWWKVAWYCSLDSAVPYYRSWAKLYHLSFPLLLYDPFTSALKYFNATFITQRSILDL